MMPPHARAKEYDPRFSWQKIPHYWGDPVRMFFLAAAAISVFFIPLVGALLPLGSLVEIAYAIVLVILAGLTHPHSKAILIADLIAAALGAFLYEQAAFSQFSPEASIPFVIREAVAPCLIFALYFSVKTVRAMTLHMIGHRDTFGEFVDPRDNAGDEKQ